MSEVLELGQPTLGELAATANCEHELVLEAGQAMLVHAVRVGKALACVKSRLESGQWQRWLDENFVASRATATTYVRISKYENHLPTNVKSITQAAGYLRSLPTAQKGGNMWNQVPAEVRTEAVRLRGDGLSNKTIAEVLGVSENAVGRWLNPAVESAARKRWEQAAAERRDVRKARADREQRSRDAAIKRMGGSVAESYSMLRKTAQALDRAIVGATDREIRVALTGAYSKLTQAEDQLVRALGVS